MTYFQGFGIPSARTVASVMLQAVILLAVPPDDRQLIIQVFTSEGVAIPDGRLKIKLTNTRTLADMSDRLRRGRAELPLGTYLLEVRADPYYIPYQQIIRVWDERVTAKLILVQNDFVDYKIPPKPAALKGAVTPWPVKGDDIWVKVLPLIDNMTSIRDVPLDDVGSYQISGLNPGTYVILLIRGTTLLDSRSVHIEQYESEIVNFDLSGK